MPHQGAPSGGLQALKFLSTGPSRHLFGPCPDGSLHHPRILGGTHPAPPQHRIVTARPVPRGAVPTSRRRRASLVPLRRNPIFRAVRTCHQPCRGGDAFPTPRPCYPHPDTLINPICLLAISTNPPCDARPPRLLPQALLLFVLPSLLTSHPRRPPAYYSLTRDRL
ncbi:hypothetical protein BU14_0056s0013 [Porphyra umbilicalis]|uniref:Uncharacterized protein n=1 Tax=Porphyra umbilicalis TaxID=2786 RepID=A0A1X6PHA8_PORUM|nr:hypothetical protein BU14_0056s0013 [Porphyra umbilicalis]|eukprot:OSX80230.1 hypothetical protein BU14_0056s0013 [Porphyra umbilicalis]